MLRSILIVLLLLVVAGHAYAVPIVLKHSGNRSGSIGSTTFVNADFTITAFADTDDRISSTNVSFTLIHDSASISIDGVGEFQFVSGTRTFVNNFFGIVGFSRPFSTDLFNGPSDPSFLTWDLLTPIGPITGDGEYFRWFSNVITEAGPVRFDEGAGSTSRFEAVPEPNTALLLSLGLTGLASKGRRSLRS